MESFTFKNISSTDLGIIVKEMPPVTKAEKNIETFSLSGRNGDLHIDEGTYKSKKYKMICILQDLTKINQIKSLLDGVGTLELSTEPNKEYQAVVKNQIDFSKYLTYLKEFPIQFELYPIAYSKTAIEEEITTSGTFDVEGTYNVKPSITINGVGIITLNNTQVEVTETGITIDCELMNCTKNNLNKNDKVNLLDFPSLVIGTNSIVLGTGIESVIISYKEGWL